MVVKLVTFSPQKAFPQEDISDSNAALLGFMLANEAVLTQGHDQAERSLFLYRVGHQTVYAAINHLNQASGAAKSAFNFGITVYEAMAILVRPRIQPYRDTAVCATAIGMTHSLEDSAFNYLEAASDRFQTQLPNACGVVRESADRFHAHAENFAVYGAALACRLEMDTVAIN